MPLTRIDSAFLDLDAIGGIDFDVQSGIPTLKVDAVNHKVGIGTNSPREKLDVSAGRIILDQDYQFTWANGTTNRARIYGDSGNNFIVENGSSNTERLRITSTGNVGIGTSSPSVNFEVSDVTDTSISIKST